MERSQALRIIASIVQAVSRVVMAVAYSVLIWTHRYEWEVTALGTAIMVSFVLSDEAMRFYRWLWDVWDAIMALRMLTDRNLPARILNEHAEQWQQEIDHDPR